MCISLLVTALYYHFSFLSMNWYLEKPCSRTNQVVKRWALERERERQERGRTLTHHNLAVQQLPSKGKCRIFLVLFALTLGFSFATWTSAFHLTYDPMNSTREVGKKISFCKMSTQTGWMLDFINYRRKSTKTSCVIALASNSKLKKIFRNFKSHDHIKQRLVRDNCLMLRRITAQ